MQRQHVSSGAPWEAVVGYSRAIRMGPIVHVAGTTAMTADGVVGEGDPYAQTRQALRHIEAALAETGTDLSMVTRTRLYVTDIDGWESVGRAHGEFFRDIRPAATMVEVQRLIAPELLVEIEAEAYIGEG